MQKGKRHVGGGTATAESAASPVPEGLEELYPHPAASKYHLAVLEEDATLLQLRLYNYR